MKLQAGNPVIFYEGFFAKLVQYLALTACAAVCAFTSLLVAQERRVESIRPLGAPEHANPDYIEARFLPVLRLHPDDEYKPSVVTWLLPRAVLRYKGHSGDILGKGEITAQNLSTQTFAGKSSGGGSTATDFYLDYPDDADRDATRRGDTSEWACYVHISKRSPMEIQYWFYYPYNGSIALNQAHEGDWEHITVRLKLDGVTLDKIFYSSHSAKLGRWVKPEGHVTPDGRPIVYSARHTHASYPTPGTWPTEAPLVKDETKDGGEEIDYNADLGWQSLDTGWAGFEWINYNGKWGAPGTFQSSSGFPGPKFQKEWNGDPRESETDADD